MSQTKVKSGLLNFPDQTDFVKLPSGTTAQRPSSPEKGYSRYNTTDNKLEFWNGTIWQQLPGVVAPTIESVSYPGDDLAADPVGGQTITLTGTNFLAGATVEIEGTLAPVVTVVSRTEITFTAPAKTAGDYDILLTNGDNTTATFIDGITYNGLPSWTTPAGNLGTFPAGSTIPTITLVATEPDSGTVSYSVTTGALPTGLALTGADIDGTVPSPAGQTTYNFSVTASDDENQESTERAFNIVVYIQATNTVDELDPFGDSSGMAFYKLNNNYVEESGNYSDGLLVGTGSSSFSDGFFGDSLYFTGSGSRRMQMNGISNSIMGSSYSFSAWINYVSIGNNSSYFQTATGTGTYVSGSYNQFNINFLNGNIQASAKRGLYTDPNEVVGSGGIESIVGTGWRFITGTLDSSTGDIKAYLDGREVWKKEGFFVGGLTTSGPNDSEVYVGNHPNNWYNNVKFDQIRWFNKALTPLEVESLYIERIVLCGGQADTLDILGDNSCIATYQLNGNANDLSGNYSGTPNDVYYELGKFDLAGVFNGSSSFINTNYTKSGTQFSFSCWLNLNDQSSRHYVFGDFNVGGSDASSSAFFQVSSGDDLIIAVGNGSTTSSLTLTDGAIGYYNVWTHYVLSINGTSGVLYRNNVPIISGNFNFSMANGQNPLAIGMYTVYSSSGELNGSIDQVRIFNKALNSTEVTTLYNETACDALACGGTTNTLDILSDGSCIAAYPLDGSPADLSGNYNGVQTDVTYPVGKYDLAGSFNGSSSKIDTSSNLLKNTFSLSCWVNVSNLSARQVLMGNTYDGSTFGCNLQVLGTSGYVNFEWAVTNSWQNVTTTTNVADNQWHHIVVTISEGYQAIYVDNNLAGFSTDSNDQQPNNAPFRIGANWNNTEHANGQIDQVRIFNKALSSAEVTTLYNETACN